MFRVSFLGDIVKINSVTARTATVVVTENNGLLSSTDDLLIKLKSMIIKLDNACGN